jgi:hypothetical protein
VTVDDTRHFICSYLFSDFDDLIAFDKYLFAFYQTILLTVVNVYVCKKVCRLGCGKTPGNDDYEPNIE